MYVLHLPQSSQQPACQTSTPLWNIVLPYPPYSHTCTHVKTSTPLWNIVLPYPPYSHTCTHVTNEHTFVEHCITISTVLYLNCLSYLYTRHKRAHLCGTLYYHIHCTLVPVHTSHVMLSADMTQAENIIQTYDHQYTCELKFAI